MRILLAICFFLSLHFYADAQLTVDVDNPEATHGNYGAVKVYDPSAIGSKRVTVINYGDMHGSPFWNDKWAPALLYLNRGTIVKLKQVKMNLYTQEVHYLDNNGAELAAETGLVSKVVFLKAEDSTKVLSVFEARPDYTDNNGKAYFQVLDTGKVQLLLLQKILRRQENYNALSGKWESGFFSKYHYAISNNGRITPLTALNSNTIAAAIPADTVSKEWLRQNRNKLKNEAEVISFLDFYNGTHKPAK